MVRWLARHADALAGRPTALVSASLTAADDTDAARATTQALIDEVIADTHWTPTTTLAVAGALQYQAYNLPTRLLMKLISRSHGGPTDTSHDAELTDWAGVERFARAFAAGVRQSSALTALRGTTTTGHGA
jgi:menaquinone-dependent protoporphyrinogen oxidase